MRLERGDQDRQDIIRRLELECQEAEAKLLKASQDHSSARRDKHNAEARLLRAKSPPEGSNFCLMCWINDQRLSYLRHASSPEPGIEHWTCETAACGHTEARKTGA